MTSQEAKGSFMRLSDVIKYFDIHNWAIELSKKYDLVEIDEILFIPTFRVEMRLSEQGWKEMQTKVTTHIFGIETLK